MTCWSTSPARKAMVGVGAIAPVVATSGFRSSWPARRIAVGHDTSASHLIDIGGAEPSGTLGQGCISTVVPEHSPVDAASLTFGSGETDRNCAMTLKQSVAGAAFTAALAVVAGLGQGVASAAPPPPCPPNGPCGPGAPGGPPPGGPGVPSGPGNFHPPGGAPPGGPGGTGDFHPPGGPPP